MFLAAFVCLCVCQHDNFRTSKCRMMKLGVGLCVCMTTAKDIDATYVVAPVEVSDFVEILTITLQLDP